MILPVGEEGKYTDDSNYTYRPEPSTEAYETDEFGSIIEPATEADDDGNYDKERGPGGGTGTQPTAEAPIAEIPEHLMF